MGDNHHKGEKMRGATAIKSEIRLHTKNSEANQGEGKDAQTHMGQPPLDKKQGEKVKQGNEILDELIGIMQ